VLVGLVCKVDVEERYSVVLLGILIRTKQRSFGGIDCDCVQGWKDRPGHDNR